MGARARPCCPTVSGSVNRPFRIEPEASAELEDAVVWYEGRRPGLGVEFLQAVDAMEEWLATLP